MSKRKKAGRKRKVVRPKKPLNHRQLETDKRAYQRWRDAVLLRDKRICRMPSCGQRGGWLQVHHIKRWADSPYLRYSVRNGITLCKQCHEKVKDKEAFYEKLFTNLLNAHALKRIRDILHGKTEEGNSEIHNH